MRKFHERSKLSKLTQEEIENSNSPISLKEKCIIIPMKILQAQIALLEVVTSRRHL